MWVLGALFLGCSQLPTFAAPSKGALDPSAVDGADLITYRDLSRDDFLAKAPPADRAEHADKLGALTCAYIVTTPGTGYEMRELRNKGTSRFTVRFNHVELVAHMDRNCSWWNDGNTPEEESYVLQHEQIHFALTEVEARRRNKQGRKLVQTWSEEHATAQAAEDAVRARLRAFVDEAMEDLIEVNTAFDKETSVERSPERQQKWFARVNAQLAEFE